MRTAIALACLVLAAGVPAAAWEIGHTAPTFTDPARQRQIPVEIYYPAEAGGDDVPVAPGAFPVLVFGHGYLIGWESYAYFWQGLAPEGYIVVLPRTETGLLPSHLEFGRDLAFAAGKLQELGGTSGSLFHQHVAAGTALMGHSMGGGASFLSAGYAPAATALANLAAAETSPSAIAAAAGIELPALLISGSRDCVTPPASHQIPMYEALASACKTRVTLTGASHCRFAMDNWICRLGETGAGCSATIEPAVQEVTTVAILRPWLDWVLKDEPQGWSEFQSALLQGEAAGTLTYEQDCPQPSPTPSATPSPTPAPPTATPTAEPTATASPSATSTPEATPTPAPPPVPAAGTAGLVLLAGAVGLLARRAPRTTTRRTHQ